MSNEEQQFIVPGRPPKEGNSTSISTGEENVNNVNPFPVKDIDVAERASLNTVFGEKMIGVRKPTSSSQFQYGIPTDFADVTLVNGGTAITEDSLLKVATGTNVAGSATIQTKEYLRYIPGHEAYIFFTGVFTQGVADSSQRAGLFDDNDGFYVGFEEEQFCICKRRDGVNEQIDIDITKVFKDGTFDPTLGNVYKISFGYLGFATIHFEVMTPEGNWVLMGEFKYPNTSTVTHILQTNLPARAEATNAGNNTNLEFRTGSFTLGIVDGGGADPSARIFSASVPTTAVTAGDFLVGVFRNKDTFNSMENRIKAQLILISTSTDLSKNASLRLVRNMTITNVPTWTDVNTENSTMEFSLDATVDFATGDDLIPWTMARIDSFFEQIEDQLIFLRPGETSNIVITTPIGTTGDVTTAFRWKELF